MNEQNKPFNQTCSLDQVQKATILIKDQFRLLTDKGGAPYTDHLVSVAMFTTAEDHIPVELYNELRITALLHDILEDTDIGFDYLVREFSIRIAQNVQFLTKVPNAKYTTYIDTIKQEYFKGNIIPLLVKIADLRHNMDVSRLKKPLTQQDMDRVMKYHNSWLKLSSVVKAQPPHEMSEIIEQHYAD